MRCFLIDQKWTKKQLMMNLELFIIRSWMDSIYARYPNSRTSSDCGKYEPLLKKLSKRYFYLDELLDP